jgi:hypothetical protein
MEVLLYAPIGFALEARKLLPTFIDRGRQQVQMARMIGQFAVGQGQVEAAKHLERAQSQAQRQARAILAELGLSDQDTSSVPDPTPGRVTTEASAARVTVPAAEPAAPQASAASADLAIAGYDALAASQVIPRLAGLGPTELEAVRHYESSHRARKTILGRIAQLQGD